MKYFQRFEWTGYTFEERVGSPESVEAAIGKVAIDFSNLQHEMTAILKRLAPVDPSFIAVDPAALSFRQKVDSLASLVPVLNGVGRLNPGPLDAVAMIEELKRLCLEAKALRDQVLDANWGAPYANGLIPCCLPGVNAVSDSSQAIGAMSAGQILDIADFIVCISIALDEFFDEPDESGSVAA